MYSVRVSGANGGSDYSRPDSTLSMKASGPKILLIHMFMVSSGFSSKIRGANGLDLPSILEKTLVLDKYLGIFVNYTYFL